MAEQKAYFPPEAQSYFTPLKLGGNGGREMHAKIVQWADNSLSLIVTTGAADLHITITPEQCQQLAAALTAADRAAREVH